MNITTVDVKRQNKKRVLRYIYEKKSVQRQMIADDLGLSLPTVNQNLKSLASDGYIVFKGNYDSTGGRKAQIISINKEKMYGISVNVTVDESFISIVNFAGEIIVTKDIKTKFNIFEKEEAIKKSLISHNKDINSEIIELLSENDIDNEQIIGVALTVPGSLDIEGNVILAIPSMNIMEMDTKEIKESYDFPVFIYNDAKAMAFAESGNGFDLKLFVMINDGVGGAFIRNTRIDELDLENIRNAEFGHMTIRPNGKKCNCGKLGCVEAYLSSNVFSEELDDNNIDSFFKIVQSQNNDKKTKKYQEILKQYIEYLGLFVNNLYVVGNAPIVIGGPVAKYLKPYEEEIKKCAYERFSFNLKDDYLEISERDIKYVRAAVAVGLVKEFINNCE